MNDIFFTAARWLVTIAAIIFYGYITAHNLQQLHVGWKRKRAKDDRPAESMIFGNWILLAAIACPLTEHSDIAWPFWIIMFLVDPASWYLIALPFLAMYMLFAWLLSPIKYLRRLFL